MPELSRFLGIVIAMFYRDHELFARSSWLEWIESAGFSVRSRIDRWNRDVFRGEKPVNV